VAVLVLFVFLFGAVNYIQVFAASDLANNPANKRLILLEYRVDRGDILARDAATVLAESRPTGGQLKFLRRYPDGPLYAGVTGYYSFVFGRSELEQAYNDFLAARATELFPTNLVDEILGRPKRGATVITTIDPQLQQVAAEALGERAGAVAAIDPRTGEVLVLVSQPTFDPNPLSSHDGKEIRRAWDVLNEDPGKPLLSNANDQLYPPGSTFKLITAAAALENGLGPNSTVPNPPELELPQTTETLENFGGEHCLGGAPQITLAQALQVSCNVAFGQFGLKLGAERLVEQARRFGFGRKIDFDIPFAEGRFPEPSFFEERIPAIAFSAIGQQDVATNPLHMALVAGAIANGGILMQPQLVREVRDPQGLVIRGFEAREWGQAMSPENAAILTQMMEAVVASGTGTAARIPGVTVAGKTGTAQHGEGEAPHAWFVCFAPTEDPAIAVAVVVLNGGDLGSEATGGAVAAPIARAVLEAALGAGG
jgi:peptidoglycan glycosyltransferase